MTGEVSIFGVLVATALTSAILAFVVFAVLRPVLARIGFYQWVWYRNLVDVAFFVLLWGGATALVGVLVRNALWPA